MPPLPPLTPSLVGKTLSLGAGKTRIKDLLDATRPLGLENRGCLSRSLAWLKIKFALSRLVWGIQSRQRVGDEVTGREQVTQIGYKCSINFTSHLVLETHPAAPSPSLPFDPVKQTLPPGAPSSPSTLHRYAMVPFKFHQHALS